MKPEKGESVSFELSKNYRFPSSLSLETTLSRDTEENRALRAFSFV